MAAIAADAAAPPPSDDVEQQDRDDLLSSARQNTGGWDRLSARHRRSIFRYIFSRVSNQETCEDLTQEVLMRLFRGGYDGTASPRTWIFTIARNRVTDFFRSEGRRPMTHAFGAESEAPQVRASDPARKLMEEDEDARIHRWLGMLPDEQAEAVRLRIISGLSFAQTAEVLGCSVPTCKSRVRYGLAKLKAILEEVMP